jgi:hypothetical protein
MNYQRRRLLVLSACLVSLWLGISPPAAAQTDTTGLSVFAGIGGSTTFGALYERARFGGHGLTGLAVRFAPGNTQAFELAATAEGAYFFNDGEIGGNYILANGGIEFRLVGNLQQPVHYFFGVGGGVSRVRERLFRDRNTGRMTDGYVEWGPYLAPSIGFDFPVSKDLRLFGMLRLMTIYGDRVASYRYLSFFAGVKL